MTLFPEYWSKSFRYFWKMSRDISNNDSDPYKEVIRGGLKLKRGKLKFKKKVGLMFKNPKMEITCCMSCRLSFKY